MSRRSPVRDLEIGREFQERGKVDLRLLLPWKAEWSRVGRKIEPKERRQQRSVGFVTWRAACPVSGLSVESLGWCPSWPEVPGLRDRYTVAHLCPETSACFLWAGTAALERERERERKPDL